ncbi:MAG: hypothetical protein MJZ41_07685 [Bacteroidaceae bacterium]|nr:hypothetical protein [Bacteroidaceae bacterium]
MAKTGYSYDTHKKAYMEILRSYEAPADKDKEFLAFVLCVLITEDPAADVRTAEEFLATVRKRTPSVWEYIDEDMYMIDYAMNLRMLKLLMLLNEVILTTQTIESSLKISMEYNKHYTDFFINLFVNADMGDYLSNTVESHRKIYTFLSLMVDGEPDGLGIWNGWINSERLYSNPIA